MHEDCEKEGFFGVIEDPRTDEQKAKDYTHEELYGSTPYEWKEKTEWKHYDIRKQSTSSSCVAQSAAKSGSIKFQEILSAQPIYRNRKYYPLPGMYLQDAGDIFKKIGTGLEREIPSQNMDDDQLDTPVDTKKLHYKSIVYVAIDHRNTDGIAKTIEEYGSVLFTFQSNVQEWTYEPTYLGTPVTFAHCVTLIDSLLYKGKKCFIVEDSVNSYSSINGQRIMSEDFIAKRATGAMYFIFPKPTETPQKPRHTFSVPLEYGQQNDEIKILQDILKYEGYFPPTVPSSGRYLQITANAVYKWQIAHSVANISELQALQGKRFGPKSILVANSLYS